jgi:hypothetical protein
MTRPSNAHISKVSLWGMPFHGLVRFIPLTLYYDYRLALPATTLAASVAAPDDYLIASAFALGTVAHTKDGTQVWVEDYPDIGVRFVIDWELFDNNPLSAGTSRLWKNPAIPEITRDASQAASDAELGHIWRNYALFAGRNAQIARNPAKRLGGLNWVYLASDGSRWQIAISSAVSGADPLVLRYAFRRFGQFGNAAAETMSSPVNFLSISKGSPALPLGVVFGGVSATGDKVLLNTHGGNPFLTLPPLEVNAFNQDVINYGALVCVHQLEVAETIIEGALVGITITAVELKNRAQCRPGVETVSPVGTVSYTDANGNSVTMGTTFAYKKSWIMGAYFVGSAVEYITFISLVSVTGSLVMSDEEPDWPIDADPPPPPCHLYVVQGESYSENRVFEKRLTITFGSVEYVYSSKWHKVSSGSYSSTGAGGYTATTSDSKTWENITPFISGALTDESSSSGSGTGNLCSLGPNNTPNIGHDSLLLYFPTPGPIPDDMDYLGIDFYTKGGASPTNIRPIMPLPFVAGEGIWGIIEISKNTSGQYQYQYRLLSAYGTKHLLTDSAVTINAAAPINQRIPLFASAHPLTGEFIYAQESPVCYV